MRLPKKQATTMEEIQDIADRLRQLAKKYDQFAETMEAPITDKNPNSLESAFHNLEIHIARLKEG